MASDTPAAGFAAGRGPLLTLSLGAATVSFAPILVKALEQAGVGPTAIALWRCVLGALFVGGAVVVLRARLILPRPAMWLLLLAGLAFASDLFVWHRSIVLCGAGMATILGNLQVFGTATLSAVVFREPLTLRFLLAASGALVGVTLLVGVGSDVSFTPDYLRGIGFGLATAAFYSVFLVALRGAGKLSKGAPSLVPLAWFSLYAAMFLAGAAAWETGPLLPPSWKAWALLVLLALIAQSAGWWAISRSLPHVQGAVGGLVLLLQPVLATIWAVLLFGETLEPVQILGAVITLSAVYLGSATR